MGERETGRLYCSGVHQPGQSGASSSAGAHSFQFICAAFDALFLDSVNQMFQLEEVKPVDDAPAGRSAGMYRLQ